MRSRLALLASLLVLVLAAPAGAAVPSFYPGAELMPIRGMAYQPAPSNYEPTGSGVYYDTDFFNADFSQLWDDAGQGRGDLKAMAGQLKVNLVHLYDWNPARNHLPALNRARELGIKVAVPVSNYFVFDDANAAADIEAILRQVYVDTSGAASTTPHPAVGMLLVANEPEQVTGSWTAPVTTAVSRVVAAEQAVGATKRLPLSVPFSFAVDTTSPGANNPNGYAAVGQNNSIMAALTAQAGLGASFVKSRFIASGNTQQDGSFMSGWIPDFKAAIPGTPVWFPEQGTGVAKSCAGYPSPCTPSEAQQATFNADQFAATKPGAGDVVLGGAQFEWVDERWKGGDNEPTFGIYKYGANPRSVPTAGGSYLVDPLVAKPSLTALKNAFTASPAPPTGQAPAAGTTVASRSDTTLTVAAGPVAAQLHAGHRHGPITLRRTGGHVEITHAGSRLRVGDGCRHHRDAERARCFARGVRRVVVRAGKHPVTETISTPVSVRR